MEIRNRKTFAKSVAKAYPKKSRSVGSTQKPYRSKDDAKFLSINFVCKDDSITEFYSDAKGPPSYR